MNYPFWDTQLPYGPLMGFIAIIHVFVSHFAIGGGLYLVLAEAAARRRNDLQRLAFVQSLSKFFLLVTVVFGALTGVAIWFIIGLLNPAATEVLIHNFVWGWAIEWTFFIVEIAAAILYYYGWQHMKPRDHLLIGWIYFAAAWLSLFVINGIIAFMLTPGQWLATGGFWDGFFNQTFWPSLVLRTGVCIMLAGLYALMVASRLPGDDFKYRVVRHNSRWALVGLALTIPSFYWYLRSIPIGHIQSAANMVYPLLSINRSYVYAVTIALLVLVFGLLLPRRLHPIAAGLIMLSGLAWFGSFEWFRESVRKPFAISGYMYANGLEVARAADYQKDGYLAHLAFRTGDDGADLFRRSCRSCHTIGGYRPLKPAFDGTDAAFIAGVIKGLHRLKGSMPPFQGTASEAQLLAAHIRGRLDTRPLREIYGLDGLDLGRKIYAIRCGRCHEFGGFNDKSESILGLSEKDYEDLIKSTGDFSEEMPAFTGDDVEKKALIQYLLSKKPGGAK
jgi:mono/diheme cytochrome c family protein